MLFYLFTLVLIFNLSIVKSDNFVRSTYPNSIGSLKNNFKLLGWTINFTQLSFEEIPCDYLTTCPKLVCNILSNKTLSDQGLAFVVLENVSPVTCDKISFTSNSLMISFIVNFWNGGFTNSFSCTSAGDCFNQACILFNQNSNTGIGFTGQCNIF